MNKKIFSLTALFSAALLFTGCAGEEDDLFSQSAMERLEASKTAYTERLASSAGGWVMEYYPQDALTDPEGVGYVLLAKFNADNTVKVAMKNVFTSSLYKEDTSIWEVITDTGPVLSFNTYNECMHAFSDPNDLSFTTTSETGTGAGGDYEFVIIDLQDDEQFATLKGKKQSTYVRMTRLPEGTDFESYINDLETFKSTLFPETAPNFDVLTVGDSVMKVEDISGHFPNIYPYKGDNIANESYHAYTITKRDGQYYLRFREAINGTGETSEQEFVYDEANDIFNGVENAANTLAGPNPTEYMFSGSSWTWTRASEMSESMQSLYSAMHEGFRSLSFTLNSVSMEIDGNEMALSVRYRQRGSSNSSLKYLFDIEAQGDGTYKMTYREPSNTAASNSLNVVAGLKSYIEGFNGAYKAEGAVSNFDMSSMKLISASGEGKWLVMTSI